VLSLGCVAILVVMVLITVTVLLAWPKRDE